LIKLAIWGLGAAGRARLEAALTHQEIQLAGIISRRPEAATRSLEEVLADPQTQAVAVSLENTGHESAVHRALEAGKHVLVDYPLALTRDSGEALFALARKKNRVLHVEHIGLLSEEHRELKLNVNTKGPLKKGEYLFQAGFNDKLADAERTGPLPLLALPRLLQLADLWGLPTLEEHRLERFESGYSLHLHLRFPRGGILGFTEERKTGLSRRRSLAAQCANGPVSFKTGVQTGGLFAKDLDHFIRRVRGETPCYYDEKTMLDLIGLLQI